MIDLGNRNILIVEDEYLSANFLFNILRDLSFNNITIVSSADEALEIVKSKKIDLAFMDININGSIDGISCAILINQIYSIPIIYITGYRDSSIIEESSRTNIYGFLLKPFDENDVQIVLNVAIVRLNKESDKTVKNHKQINISDEYSYCLKNKILFENDASIKLTKKELEVLDFLCKNINQNISYELFREYVWNNKLVANSTIRDTILRLRKKVPKLTIENSIGLGYCLRKT